MSCNMIPRLLHLFKDDPEGISQYVEILVDFMYIMVRKNKYKHKLNC